MPALAGAMASLLALAITPALLWWAVEPTPADEAPLAELFAQGGMFMYAIAGTAVLAALVQAALVAASARVPVLSLGVVVPAAGAVLTGGFGFWSAMVGTMRALANVNPTDTITIAAASLSEASSNLVLANASAAALWGGAAIGLLLASFSMAEARHRGPAWVAAVGALGLAGIGLVQTRLAAVIAGVLRAAAFVSPVDKPVLIAGSAQELQTLQHVGSVVAAMLAVILMAATAWVAKRNKAGVFAFVAAVAVALAGASLLVGSMLRSRSIVEVATSRNDGKEPLKALAFAGEPIVARIDAYVTSTGTSFTNGAMLSALLEQARAQQQQLDDLQAMGGGETKLGVFLGVHLAPDASAGALAALGRDAQVAGFAQLLLIGRAMPPPEGEVKLPADLDALAHAAAADVGVALTLQTDAAPKTAATIERGSVRVGEPEQPSLALPFAPWAPDGPALQDDVAVSLQATTPVTDLVSALVTLRQNGYRPVLVPAALKP